MLGGARWSAMLGGAKGTRTHVCARPCLNVQRGSAKLSKDDRHGYVCAYKY